MRRHVLHTFVNTLPHGSCTALGRHWKGGFGIRVTHRGGGGRRVPQQTRRAKRGIRPPLAPCHANRL